MGNYKIWIGADEKDGCPPIGARACRDYNSWITEQIWPSQLAHRCTGRGADGRIAIMTPTDAEAGGFEIIARFPRADGSLSAR